MRYLVTFLVEKHDTRFIHCDTPNEVSEIVKHFLSEKEKLGKGKIYVYNQYLNMDETFVFVNPSKRYFPFQE